MALRIFCWINEFSLQKQLLDLNFAKKFKKEDFYLDNENAYENSKSFLSNFLPLTCPTCFMFEFDTISYCIRHTLKKPRELITIFNAIIEEIILKHNIRYFIENPKEIKATIHSTQEYMIKSALSMYDASFDAINGACSIALTSTRFVFTLNDIKSNLKEAENYIKKRGFDYDKDDILRILFESGLVGVVNEIRHIENPPDFFKTNEPFDVIISNFEYQIKGRIIPILSDQYVIHPMCYEYYRCYLDNCSMVYPNRFADEDDIISTILKKI